MMPRVSIIVRTKNRLVFLARCLLSIQQQSFQEWEAVIVNDGGDAAALEELLTRVPDVVRDRVVVVHHATSQGRWAAANAGVKAARGDFLVIHDDDDSWQGTFLSTMAAVLDTAPLSVGAVACHTQYVDEVVVDGTIQRKGVRPFNNWAKNITLFRMAARNFITTNSVLYRASLHNKLGLYREELPVLGDWDFYMRLLSRFDMQLVPQVLANYHLRPADAGEQLGNSVVAGIQNHFAVEARILNALLREDLDAGKVGLGTIANLAYDLRELRENSSTTIANAHQLAQLIRTSAAR
jgi:glycosyltransferase involved in cell wall biosynthesis